MKLRCPRCGLRRLLMPWQQICKPCRLDHARAVSRLEDRQITHAMNRAYPPKDD